MLEGAIIGFGNIVVRGHVPAYLSDPALAGRARIRAVMDLSEESRARVNQALPGAAFYTELGALLERERLDFVDICTPPSTHAGYVKECAGRGLHIICEKPLAESMPSAEAAAESLRGKKLVFMPCHQYRYSPLWQSIGSIVSSGGIGDVTLFQANVFRLQADTGTPAWNPQWRTAKAHGGGGILADTGAHYFYLAQHLFGTPKKVSASLRTLKHHGYGVEDTAIVLLEYGGLMVELNLTWAAGRRANSVSVVGSAGSLEYDGSRLIHTDERASREIPMPDVSDKSQYVGWYVALLKEFVHRVESGNHSDDMLCEALTVMRLLELSSRSSEQGSVLEYA